MAQVLKMPRPRLTQKELEAAGTQAIGQYKRSKFVQRLLIYGSMAGLVGIGMLAEYLLTHT
jgi:hypothetical protein